MHRLNGKVAIVTGGASGFGAAICKLFVEQGAKVVVADINERAGLDMASSLGETAVFALCDHTDPNATSATVDAALSRWGAVDILVNNAGIGWTGHFDTATDTDWDRQYRVNFEGQRLMTLSALPALRESARKNPDVGAALILVSSGLGLYAVPKSAPYAVSKHAVIGLMRALAQDLGPENIRVNAICPGIADTPLGRNTGGWGDPDAVLEQLRAMTPLRRLAEPIDIANAALFLASREGRCVHSQALRVDGGART